MCTRACIHMLVCMYVGLVVVKGQLAGVGSPSTMWFLRIVLRLGRGRLYPRSHLTGLIQHMNLTAHPHL